MKPSLQVTNSVNFSAKHFITQCSILLNDNNNLLSHRQAVTKTRNPKNAIEPIEHDIQ